MKIEFYIPSDEFIPSTLRLKVDDEIDVYYEKLQTDFGYRFTFLKFQQGVSRETATEIVNQIVDRMVSQSYDHGSQWREIGIREIFENDYELSITVFFRVRDAR